jgi:hypothetical protein
LGDKMSSMRSRDASETDLRPENITLFLGRHKALSDYGEEVVIGVCDEDLLGKVFTEGGIKLELNKEFFGVMKIGGDELLNYLLEASSAFIVGEKAVKLAIKLGFINPDAVARVEGIPYAMYVRSLLT